jgi:hypothetical protein
LNPSGGNFRDLEPNLPVCIRALDVPIAKQLVGFNGSCPYDNCPRTITQTTIYALYGYAFVIRAWLAHSAAEFNILPGRWQHVWLVAIVPPERWGEMDRNDCHTA